MQCRDVLPGPEAHQLVLGQLEHPQSLQLLLAGETACVEYLPAGVQHQGGAARAECAVQDVVCPVAQAPHEYLVHQEADACGLEAGGLAGFGFAEVEGVAEA